MKGGARCPFPFPRLVDELLAEIREFRYDVVTRLQRGRPDLHGDNDNAA